MRCGDRPKDIAMRSASTRSSSCGSRRWTSLGLLMGEQGAIEMGGEECQPVYIRLVLLGSREKKGFYCLAGNKGLVLSELRNSG